MPTIHLNGTAQKDLLADALAVMDALRTALDAMRTTSPNQRDYYPQPAGTWEQVVREHERRIGAVRVVLQEYESLAEYLASKGSR